MLHGHPISAALPEDLGFGERFWYWRGHSGHSYIHSIYARESCPPLPGAVFVAVRRTPSGRVPLSVGRFPLALDGLRAFNPAVPACDELHVHLLARDDDGARGVMADLEAELTADEPRHAEPQGFHAPRQLEFELAA